MSYLQWWALLLWNVLFAVVGTAFLKYKATNFSLPFPAFFFPFLTLCELDFFADPSIANIADTRGQFKRDSVTKKVTAFEQRILSCESAPYSSPGLNLNNE